MLYSSSLRLLACFGSFLCAFVFLELVHFSMCFDLLALCSVSVPTVRWLVCSLTCLGLINQAVWFVFFLFILVTLVGVATLFLLILCFPGFC